MTHCGTIAIIGRPNVGKSTLLNAILGEKISITADKPQTTRDQILGIKTVGDHQMIYIDTPGLHQGVTRSLNKAMNQAAKSAIEGVDVVVLMVEASNWRDEDEWVLNQITTAKTPIILALNKVDQIKDRTAILPLIQVLSKKHDFHAIIPLSAEKKIQLEALEQEILKLLPESPHFYPDDQITDRSERFLVSEMIREKIVRLTGQELPHASAVQIEAYQETKKVVKISALIWVEREGQKAIIIGDAGQKLKTIGQQARLELEQKFKKKVYLQLWVKVHKNWFDRLRAV